MSWLENGLVSTLCNYKFTSPLKQEDIGFLILFPYKKKKSIKHTFIF